MHHKKAKPFVAQQHFFQQHRVSEHLLDSLPHWRMFLMSYAYALFRRAIREHGYGKKNPGNMDLWSATYLPSCDYFITADKRQRRALRIINQHSSRPARIVSYDQWRANILKS